MAGDDALSAPLLEAFALTPRAHVALVGAGGKTTLMWLLVDEGRRNGWRVAAGTTTKVGAWQIVPGVPFLSGRQVGDKLVGLPPEGMDAAFEQGDIDLLVVEADGAHAKVVKAPAGHEPVIPSSASLVVAVIGADAIDRVIEDVAHRPMRAAAVCGCGPYERLTVERAAVLLSSPNGAAKSLPEGARFAVAITRIGPRQRDNAVRLGAALAERGVTSVPIPWSVAGYSRHA